MLGGATHQKKRGHGVRLLIQLNRFGTVAGQPLASDTDSVHEGGGEWEKMRVPWEPGSAVCISCFCLRYSKVCPMPDTPRLSFAQTLRFRLALLYTLLALFVVGMVSLLITAQLLRSLDVQFQARLEERADRLADAFSSGTSGLGKPTTPSGSYTMIVNGEGVVVAANAGVRDYEKSPFPFKGQEVVLIQGFPVRTTTRPLVAYGNGGFVWVGLPEDSILVARQTAMRLLWIALLLTPLLMLPLGWLLGRRVLGGLGHAASMAAAIDPEQTLKALPLPNQRDEVFRFVYVINQLLERIELQQAREKQLLGQIVHELGAPLTVIKASLERAAQSGNPDVIRAALVADELNFTTQDLMQLARGQLEIKVAWHYIAAKVLQGRLDRLVAGTEFTGDWDTAYVLCDPDRLTQALRNLLANARRAAGANGWVGIHLQDTPETVRFTVRDSGPGLPHELGERIFDPFVSGAGSSGLGLSVARQIAKAHGGVLHGGNHKSAQGKVGGAEFILELPGSDLSEDEA